jgi:hypothetical protein
MELYRTFTLSNKKRNDKNNDLLLFKRFIEKKNRTTLIKRKIHKKIFFLTQNNSQTNSEKSAEKKRMEHIKKLLNISANNFTYDGYAVKRKKNSFYELIGKVGGKENRKSIENNHLFKIPFPLLQFLSNRKIYNNSSSLIINLLNNDISKLLKEQIRIINESHDDNIIHNKSLKENRLNRTHNYFHLKNKQKNKLFNFNKNRELFHCSRINQQIIPEDNQTRNINNTLYNGNCNLNLFNRYIKDCATNNDLNKNKRIFIKKNNYTKSEKPMSIKQDIFINKSKKEDKFCNTYDENEPKYNIKSLKNTIFKLKNSNFNWYK